MANYSEQENPSTEENTSDPDPDLTIAGLAVCDQAVGEAKEQPSLS